MNSSGLADEHSSDDVLFLPAVTSGGPSPANPPLKTKKDLRFWLIVVSICVSVFVSALEYVCFILFYLLRAMYREITMSVL